MTFTRATGLLLVLVATLLSFFFVKTQAIDFAEHAAYTSRLLALRELDATLNQDVLRARYGMLPHYDPLVADLAQLRAVHAELGMVPGFVDEQGKAKIILVLDGYARALERKESLVESFKSENAVLKNSLQYVPVLVAGLTSTGSPPVDGTLATDLNSLLRDVLLYNVLASPDLEPRIRERVGALSAARQTAATGPANGDPTVVVAHVRTILAAKPAIDALIRDMTLVPTTELSDDLSAIYGQYYEEALHSTNMYRLMLYILSVVLACGILYIILKLRHATVALRARARELAASETRLRTVYEAVACGVLVQDASRVVIHANKVAEQVLGRSLAEMLGRRPEPLWNAGSQDGSDLPAAAHPAALALSTGLPVRDLALRVVRPDGEDRWLQVDSVPVLGDDGQAMQTVSTFVDITRRHLAEETLHQREEQLRQAQKMEAVGLLAGGIAHDFNNLLTVINGFADLLLVDPEPAVRRLYLEEILKAGERAASLTTQLLAFSRQQVLQPQVLDLNAVVADMDKLLRRVIGEDIDLITVRASALDFVRADRGQIAQVIMNLAANARDAMPTGGKLTIETANVELDGRLSSGRGDVPPGRYVMLAVGDTGCGMDAQTQARIFEPFFTTKEQGKGTGLGLATVYGIVKQSGGDITVASEPGLGTVFRVYLPHHKEEARVDETTILAPVVPSGLETLLLVEDEFSVRLLASTVLESAGYTVLVASDGEEALQFCQQYEGPIDLLVTDVVMPGISGRELADRMAALRTETKVLYMSGYTADVAVRHGVLESSVAYLQKPFAPLVLAQKVRDVLDVNLSETGARRG